MPTVRKVFLKIFWRAAQSTHRGFGDYAAEKYAANGSALERWRIRVVSFLDVIEHFAAFGHLAADLLLGVHDGRVVAAERLADLGQRQIGELAAQIHGDLAGLRERPGLSGPRSSSTVVSKYSAVAAMIAAALICMVPASEIEVAQHDLGQRLVDRASCSATRTR